MEGSRLNLITLGYAGRNEAVTIRAEGASSALHALEFETRSHAELLARIVKRLAASEGLVEIALLADRQVFVTRLQRRHAVDHRLYEANAGRPEKPALSLPGSRTPAGLHLQGSRVGDVAPRPQSMHQQQSFCMAHKGKEGA